MYELGLAWRAPLVIDLQGASNLCLYLVHTLHQPCIEVACTQVEPERTTSGGMVPLMSPSFMTPTPQRGMIIEMQ